MKQPKSAGKKKNIFTRIGKILAWILSSILLLFILIWILIQIPAVQNFIVGKVTKYVEGKIGTPVRIGYINISFPKKIVLESLYVEDQAKDTLLYGGKLKVDISIFKLLRNTVEINEVDLDGITTHIQRNAAGRYNFDYIIDAFASEDTTTSESPGTKFSINDIVFDNINIKYHDDYMGYDIGFFLNHFDTDIKTFDLENSEFKIGDINLNGLTTSIRQFKPVAEKIRTKEKTSSQASSPLPNIVISEVNLSKINFDYQNEIDSVFSNLVLGKLSVEPEKIDLKNRTIRVNDLSLQNTTTLIRLGRNTGAKQVAKKVEEATDSTVKKAKEQGWVFAIDNFNLEKNRFTFDDNNSPSQSSGIDYSHLDIKNITLKAKKLFYQSDSISGKINQLAFKDKSGANAKSLSTKFLYTNQQAYLKDLDLETEDTHIKRNIAISYPSITSLADDIGSMKIDAALAGSVIGFKDILYYAPVLENQPLFANNRDAKLRTSLVLKGSISDLKIQRLVMAGFNNTLFDIEGDIKGLPNANKLTANLNIRNLSSSKSDVTALLPENSLPGNINLPGQFSIKGTFNGGLNHATTNLNLASSYGNAQVKATVDQLSDSIHAAYEADVRLMSFNVGKLIKQDSTIGPVSMNTHASGTGYTIDKMHANMDATLQTAVYNGYTYKDIVLNGKVNDGLVDLNANIDDPNIDIDLVAKMDLQKTKPALRVELMVDSANLKALHISENELKIRTKLSADFSELDAKQPIGNARFTGTLVKTSDKRFTVDTTNINAASKNDIYSVSVTSPVADIKVDGNYTLDGIATAAMQIIDRYYAIGAPTTVAPAQQANIKAVIYKSNFLNELAPDLKLSNHIYIKGDINNTSNLLSLSAIVPSLTYKDQKIDSATMSIATKDNKINYDVTIANYSSTSMKVPLTRVSGTVANNELTYRLQVKDEKKKEKYNIAGVLKQLDGLYKLYLYDDKLVLNYENWKVDPRNQLLFGEAGVNATDFSISHKNQSLTLNSMSPAMDAPLNVDLNGFNIETLASAINSDSLFMGGIVNGNARITEITKNPLFDANLTVRDFNYKRDTLGDIVIKADNLSPESYAAYVTVSGRGNNVDINGKYITTGDGGLDFDVAIKSLDLSSIESFTAGQIRNMNGDMHGNLHIGGTASKPKIIGDVNLDSTALIVSQFNALFKVDKEKIQFRDDGIYFNKFTIVDSKRNTAIIDGQVYTNDYNHFRFNLDLDAYNFQVLNSKKKDNPLYYGLLFIDADATIRGDINKPVINGELTINENTELTIIVPQTDPQLTKRENIVEFFDQDHPGLDTIMQLAIDSLNHADIIGYDITANIEINPKATFNIVIDEANGDLLHVEGDGNLSAHMDETGKITLTGSYELKEGAYEMSINFLRRKFEIEEGSKLTWTGGPTEADIDITAVYKTKTAPIDLIEKQLADGVMNSYRQKLPFEVKLIMKGELLKPILSFDIILPSGNYNVAPEVVDATNTKLAEIRREPSELNKQVFSLLLLNRFMADNPFVSGNNTSVSTIARQSVSKLLTEQLNRLADDVIQGIDIEFGIESQDDYTSGNQQTRTDLSVGLSKQLFNDRLKVSVGSNFEVEGPSRQNEKTSNIAGDIKVDYKLTRDGRYMLRGYRVNQYEVALQGQVVETGLKFILSIDYDYWKEIIERSKEKKKQRRLEK